MKNLIPALLGHYLNLMSRISPSHAAKIGFRVFCYPFRSSIKPYQRDFFQTAEQSILEHDGLEIKLYKWNHGPRKVLFLHGWQSHSFRWKNYLSQFAAEEYTIYALDAPGHGLSSGSFLTVPLYSDVIEKFMEENGPFDTVIGHSLGAFTILYTLDRLPNLPVLKLVLLAPPGHATEFLDFYRQITRLSARSVDIITKHFTHVIGHPLEFFSAPKFAAKANRPGLIIHDRGDNETSYKHSVAINEAWPESTLIITEGLSHNLKSPEIVERVAAFIKSEVRQASMSVQN